MIIQLLAEKMGFQGSLPSLDLRKVWGGEKQAFAKSAKFWGWDDVEQAPPQSNALNVRHTTAEPPAIHERWYHKTRIYVETT